MYTGPKLNMDNLVFGYDTGYGVANNSVTTRFYQGEPTVNLITDSGTSNTGWVGYGWTGSQAISSDYSNTYEFTATNGWHNRTFDTGVTSGGTIYVNFEYKLKQHQTTQTQLFVLNGTHLGSYITYIGSGSMSHEWKTFSGSFTANANSSKIAIGPRGADSSGLTDIVYIRNLQVESKDHATPFVNGTRSNTASLIDLKKTADVDLSNVSFDSTAQPTFDGTDDVINLPNDLGYSANSVSVFAWYKINGSPGNSYHIICGDTALEISIHSSATYIRTGVSTTSGRHVQNDGNQTLNDGNYHYYGFTFDGSTKRAYIDGVQVGTQSVAGTLTTSFSGRKVGAFSGGYWANGDLPVYKVYNKVLTAEEIKNNFNAYKNRFDL